MHLHDSIQRILIIGPGGSGKSTLAAQLGPRLGLPAINLDSLYWHDNWQPTPDAEWDAEVDRLVAEPAWIIDGNYSRTLSRRLARAEAVVWLDLSRWRCLTRVLSRQLRYWGRARPGLPDGCRERLTLEFLGWIWTYGRTRRPRIAQQLAALVPAVPVFHLRTPAEVEAFVDDLAVIDLRQTR